MLLISTIAIIVPASIVVLIDLVFLAELFLGLRRPPAARARAGIDRQVVILMPAHNEQSTLERAMPYLQAIGTNDRKLLIIADNCTDTTAATVRDAGLDVVERADALRRGKGYALDHGRAALRAAPPAAVIVLDADCELDAAGLDRIAARALAEDRPIQSSYVFRPALSAAPVVQLSNFAFLVKNRFRQLGLSRIGASAILAGSGMAFPWAIFDKLDLATGNIVEDLMLTIDLVDTGSRVGFEPDATTLSDCSSTAGTTTQRARWEGGFLAMARRHGLRLLWRGLSGAGWPSLWLGLNLMVPPLTLLLMLNAVLIGLLVALVPIAPTALWAALVLVVAVVLMGVGLVQAWRIEGHRHLSRAALWRIPSYVVWKALLFARLVRGDYDKGWVRTERK